MFKGERWEFGSEFVAAERKGAGQVGLQVLQALQAGGGSTRRSPFWWLRRCILVVRKGERDDKHNAQPPSRS